MTTSSKPEFVAAFVDMTSALSSGRDPDEFVQVLVERSLALLGVTDVGVLLEGADSNLRVAASSSNDMHIVELLEVHIDEGPCFDAYKVSESIVADELKISSDRWPTFASEAYGLGFRSVYAVPVRAQGRSIGAMNFFCDTTSGMSAESLEIAGGLADFASLGIRLISINQEQVQLADQLKYALDSRVAIEQAKGMIAAQLDTSIQIAFDLLRSKARNEGRTLRAVAAAVIAGEIAGHTLAVLAE